MENRYPENIMRILRQRLDLDPKCNFRDREINIMTPNEAFEAILEWHGIIGYGSRIRGWIEDIYDLDFDTLNGYQM